jgi:hypothetical protein
MPKGHKGDYHEQVDATGTRSGWYDDHSDDPGALESEARCRPTQSNSEDNHG